QSDEHSDTRFDERGIGQKKGFVSFSGRPAFECKVKENCALRRAELPPVFPWSCSRELQKHPAKVALVEEARVQSYLPERFVGFNQGATSIFGAQLPHIVTDRAAKSAAELPSKVYGMHASNLGNLI